MSMIPRALNVKSGGAKAEKLTAGDVKTLARLREALVRSWGKDTMYEPDRKYWNPELPSVGQCFVTAMVVQDYLGGDIYRADALSLKGDRQVAYYNVIGGAFVDLGLDEYGETRDLWPIFCNPRRVDSNHNNRRYRLLKKRVKALLGGM